MSAVPPTDVPAPIVRNKKVYLGGYPIAHSASPAFQNFIFEQLGSGCSYNLWSTSRVTKQYLDAVRAEDCCGAAVTMPNKVAILPYLDELTPEARATSAVNTIVKVPSASHPNGIKLVGTNTDFLGVRNALLRSLRLQHPAASIPIDFAFPRGTGAAAVIGGGATTRSAVHALHTLGMSPIYLVNRDKKEVEAVQQAFPDLELVHFESAKQVEDGLGGEDATPLLMVVGAIPAITPTSATERAVYSIATAMFVSPYRREKLDQSLPLPNPRLFLEMAYKPRLTPMLKIGGALGWQQIDGIQAMIEQGLAQNRMWNASDASYEVGSGKDTYLSEAVCHAARAMVEGMADVVPAPEIDRGLTDEAA